MDYAGKSSSKLMDVTDHEAVVSGFDEMPESEEKENDKNVDHILDRLIGMLLSNNTGAAGDDQDFNDIHSEKPYWCGLDTEHQMETELEESANGILRTSGQAKSVRCLSSQMRQANHQKIINQKHHLQYLQKAKEEATASLERRQTQVYETTASATDKQATAVQGSSNFNHQKNQSSLATPVIIGLKSTELDSAAQDYHQFDAIPFEYGITEDARRQESNVSGQFDFSSRD